MKEMGITAHLPLYGLRLLRFTPVSSNSPSPLMGEGWPRTM